MKSPSFASGLGLYVHIRTTRIDNARSYSYISAAAVRIGNDVLETKDDGSILINGLPLAEEDGTFAGFPVIKTIKGSNKQIFVYDLMMLGKDDKSIQIRANLKTGMLFLDMIGNLLRGQCRFDGKGWDNQRLLACQRWCDQFGGRV